MWKKEVCFHGAAVPESVVGNGMKTQMATRARIPTQHGWHSSVCVVFIHWLLNKHVLRYLIFRLDLLASLTACVLCIVQPFCF